MSRASWSSKIGFIFAVAGSAVGLANIWRFPYLTGHHGGGAFILLYLLCLFAVGFPSFIAEIAIGRNTQATPSAAFGMLGKNRFWSSIGGGTIITGFIVSAFYSAVAGWITGYLFEAIGGSLVLFSTEEASKNHFLALANNPWWGVGFHFLFLFSCVSVLFFGVKEGIERWSKIFMPLLFGILILLVLQGLWLPGSEAGLEFLFHPDWSRIDAQALIVALGQSFFTLSVGQGTLVTYGSYLSKSEGILSSSLPIVAMDTCVSILSAIAIFSIAFSVGIAPDSGPALIFHTLPLVFGQIPVGHFVSIAFFILVFIAALTSEISALEPSIAYLCDQRGFSRKSAVLLVGAGAFLLGVPCALSTSLLKNYSVLGFPNFLDAMIYLASNILIPLGGLAAVILAGWRWGMKSFLTEIEGGSVVKYYFAFTIRYLSPVLIIIVFLHAIGFFE